MTERQQLWHQMAELTRNGDMNASAAVYALINKWTGKTWLDCGPEEFDVIRQKLKERNACS